MFVGVVTILGDMIGNRLTFCSSNWSNMVHKTTNHLELGVCVCVLWVASLRMWTGRGRVFWSRVLSARGFRSAGWPYQGSWKARKFAKRITLQIYTPSRAYISVWLSGRTSQDDEDRVKCMTVRRNCDNINRIVSVNTAWARVVRHICIHDPKINGMVR